MKILTEQVSFAINSVMVRVASVVVPGYPHHNYTEG